MNTSTAVNSTSSVIVAGVVAAVCPIGDACARCVEVKAVSVRRWTVGQGGDAWLERGGDLGGLVGLVGEGGW